jgi:aminoglycoside N3'-acetyltransferase
MEKKINLDPLKIILDKLELDNKNIYLGVDFLLLVKKLKPKNIGYMETTELILDYFIKRIGKFGNLIIPVFNFDCIPEKKFHIINSPGQSGVLGNILLKKYSHLRTSHPLYSFLCFGKNFKKYNRIKNSNGTAKNSLWKYFIEDEFDLINLGHHYSRSITHFHYIEDMLDVDYRFNLKFPVTYTNRKNNSTKKKYSFLARKLDKCDFSGVTKNCDKLFLKENVTKFNNYKNFISFKLNIKEASKLWYSDIKTNSEELISYIRPNKPNKNLLCPYDGTVTSIEKYYLNK